MPYEGLLPKIPGPSYNIHHFLYENVPRANIQPMTSQMRLEPTKVKLQSMLPWFSCPTIFTSSKVHPHIVKGGRVFIDKAIACWSLFILQLWRVTLIHVTSRFSSAKTFPQTSENWRK